MFPPTLTSGHPTLNVLRDYHEAVIEYKELNTVADNKIVPKILPYFHDVNAKEHIAANKDVLSKLKVGELMEDIRKLYHTKNWEVKFSCELHVGPNNTFRRFANAVRNANNILMDCPSRMSGNDVRIHLQSHCLKSLQDIYDKHAAHLNEIESFTDWINAVVELNEERDRDEERDFKCMTEIINKHNAEKALILVHLRRLYRQREARTP
ncbi:hypothetical protein C8F01DRAFT_1254027 [Mycena amicta]|nr:hypothetical protein C8F01DRAFT_1254027 [Mycena amicta]